MKLYPLVITDDYCGGAWTKGHWPDEEFTESLKNDWDHAPYGTIVREYWRCSFGTCGYGERCYAQAAKGQRGAFPVTQCRTGTRRRRR